MILTMHKPRVTNHEQTGFTLIEVMVALSVFAVGILGLAIMQISAIKGSSSSMKVTNVAQIASKEIEELMLLDYNDSNLVDSNADGSAGLNDNTSDTADQTFDRTQEGNVKETYTLYYNIAEDYPLVNSKTIRLILIWTDQGISHQYSFDFIKVFGG
ncbi:MAG: prepilin-type N-terminal cleavage/methylation domain-containing protein [bacterium]